MYVLYFVHYYFQYICKTFFQSIQYELLHTHTNATHTHAYANPHNYVFTFKLYIAWILNSFLITMNVQKLFMEFTQPHPPPPPPHPKATHTQVARSPFQASNCLRSFFHVIFLFVIPAHQTHIALHILCHTWHIPHLTFRVPSDVYIRRKKQLPVFEPTYIYVRIIHRIFLLLLLAGGIPLCTSQKVRHLLC